MQRNSSTVDDQQGEAGQFVQGSQPMILKIEISRQVHTVQCSYGVAQFAGGRIETRKKGTHLDFLLIWTATSTVIRARILQSIWAYRKGLSYRPAIMAT